jgi:hypothetical protein
MNIKVGDKVKIKNNFKGLHGEARKSIGTVREIVSSSPMIGIEFKHDVGGHTLGVGGYKCKQGHGWYFHEYEIYIIDSSGQLELF